MKKTILFLKKIPFLYIFNILMIIRFFYLQQISDEFAMENTATFYMIEDTLTEFLFNIIAKIFIILHYGYSAIKFIYNFYQKKPFLKILIYLLLVLLINFFYYILF